MVVSILERKGDNDEETNQASDPAHISSHLPVSAEYRLRAEGDRTDKRFAEDCVLGHKQHGFVSPV